MTTKRLYRSAGHKMLAGVCAGIAEYFGLDATLIRLAWVFLTIFTAAFPGILLYIIAWIIIPTDRLVLNQEMKLLGNLAWLVLGGLLTSVLYCLVGLLYCITIIGIPFGLQLFKIGFYALWPFGRDMVMGEGEPGCLSLLGNVIWILCGWWEIALLHVFFGLIFCVTIVGIPFGLKHFVIAKTSLFPFGHRNVGKQGWVWAIILGYSLLRRGEQPRIRVFRGYSLFYRGEQPRFRV